MSLRLRYNLIILVSVITVTTALAWLYSVLIFSAEKEFALNSVEEHLTTTRQLVDEIVQDYEQELDQVVENEESLRWLNPGDQAPFGFSRRFVNSPFLAVGLFKPNGGHYWTIVKRGWQDLLNQNSIQQMIEDLPLAKARGDVTVWSKMENLRGEPVIVVLREVSLIAPQVEKPGEEISAIATAGSRNQRKYVVVSFLDINALSKATLSFKGTGSEMIVIDQFGHTLASTSPQFLGALIKGHPIVKMALKDRKIAEKGEFDNLSGDKVIGAYQKLEQGQLFVMINHPVGEAIKIFPVYLFQSLAFAFGLAILLLALGYLILNPVVRGENYILNALTSISAGIPVKLPDRYMAFASRLRGAIERIQNQLNISEVRGREEAEDSAVSDVDRQEIYRKLGAGVSDALKGPLSAILGHAQLARSKTQQEDVKTHFTVIEREARRARGTIEDLVRLTVTDDLDFKRLNVEQELMAAVGSFRGLMAAKGIQLQKDLKTVGPVLGDGNMFNSALCAIVKNAIEAMIGRSTRNLTVMTREQGDQVVIEIKDTGDGIEDQDRARIFDPFFTTKAEDETTGMGLTVAKGIIRKMNGHIRVNSEHGIGTSFIIELPLIEARERQLEQQKQEDWAKEQARIEAERVAVEEQRAQREASKKEKASELGEPVEVESPPIPKEARLFSTVSHAFEKLGGALKSKAAKVGQSSEDLQSAEAEKELPPNSKQTSDIAAPEKQDSDLAAFARQKTEALENQESSQTLSVQPAAEEKMSELETGGILHAKPILDEGVQTFPEIPEEDPAYSLTQEQGLGVSLAENKVNGHYDLPPAPVETKTEPEPNEASSLADSSANEVLSVPVSLPDLPEESVEEGDDSWPLYVPGPTPSASVETSPPPIQNSSAPDNAEGECLPPSLPQNDVAAEYIKQSQGELAGHKPLAGSEEDDLPAAPGFDEITFTGTLPEHEELENHEGLEISAINNEPVSESATEDPEHENKENDEEPGLRVRPPKVRGKEE